MDFKEFLQGVSQFSVKGDRNAKLKFAFRIYDLDNDGFISNGELFQVWHWKLNRLCTNIDFSCLQVLKMMVGSNLKESQLQQIVDKSIRLADQDEDGKISFEEFCKAVGNTDITNKMVVEV